MGGLCDGAWHRLAFSVSSTRLALYVDCALLESVDWVNPGMELSADGLLVVGGTTDRADTPFEVSGSATPFFFSPLIIKRKAAPP